MSISRTFLRQALYHKNKDASKQSFKATFKWYSKRSFKDRAFWRMYHAKRFKPLFKWDPKRHHQNALKSRSKAISQIGLCGPCG